MGFLNTTTNQTTPANASIYDDTSNIPTPTPMTTSMTSSDGVTPTSDATDNQILPSATETGASDSAASGNGAAPTGSTEGTSSATSMRGLLTGASVVGTAFVMSLLVL